MKSRFTLGCAALLAIISLAILPAMAQQQISSGSVGAVVQISGNANTAFVNANNALQVELHNGASTVGITGTSLNVNVTGGAGGTSAADEATFTPGTTAFAPVGCFMQTTVTNNPLTNLQGGWAQCTAARALFVNQYSYGGSVLGAPSNYGTSPGAVTVPGVNAFITNQPTVAIAAAQSVGIAAGTALIGKTAPVTACGTTNFDAAWQALTTSPVAIASSTTCVQSMTFCNTSSSTAYTVTVTDNAGTPVNVIPATSIPPASCYSYPFNYEEFTSGIKWSASNVAVTGAIHGIQ